MKPPKHKLNQLLRGYLPLLKPKFAYTPEVVDGATLIKRGILELANGAKVLEYRKYKTGKMVKVETPLSHKRAVKRLIRKGRNWPQVDALLADYLAQNGKPKEDLSVAK